MCVAPGARSRLEQSSGFLDAQVDLGASKIVTFSQLSAEAISIAMCFVSMTAPLSEWQMLAEGQKVKVLRLSSSDETETTPETAQSVYAL
ncbi:MAG: hypothetical protein M3Y27_19680 [Acidobacteriota bacterium]|nr:hypothetical protein [Acidobacteriota bacterium]